MPKPAAVTQRSAVTGSPARSSTDLGGGEGGDALWLAEQGWTMTAVDVSAVGRARCGCFYP
jgi:hypothetical protein